MIAVASSKLIAGRIADAARVMLLVGMTFGSTWILVAGVVCERTIGQVHEPASAALVPNVVGTGRELASANAAFTASSAVVRLVGAPLGGVLLGAFGLRAVLLLDGASFAISLAAVLALGWRSIPTAPVPPRHVRKDFRDGFSPVVHTPIVRWVTLWMAAFLFCNGAVSGLLIPFVVDDLAGGSSDVGYVLSSLGGGYLVGAAASGRLNRTTRNAEDVIAAALAVIGCGFLGLFLAPSLFTSPPGAFVAGIGGSIALITATTALLRATPDSGLVRSPASSTGLGHDRRCAAAAIRDGLELGRARARRCRRHHRDDSPSAVTARPMRRPHRSPIAERLGQRRLHPGIGNDLRVLADTFDGDGGDTLDGDENGGFVFTGGDGNVIAGASK